MTHDWDKHTFKYMYLLLANGAGKAQAALEEGDVEGAKLYLWEAEKQAESVYLRSGRSGDYLLNEVGGLTRYFEFNSITGQLMNLRLTPLEITED